MIVGDHQFSLKSWTRVSTNLSRYHSNHVKKRNIGRSFKLRETPAEHSLQSTVSEPLCDKNLIPEPYQCHSVSVNPEPKYKLTHNILKKTEEKVEKKVAEHFVNKEDETKNVVKAGGGSEVNLMKILIQAHLVTEQINNTIRKRTKIPNFPSRDKSKN